MEMDKNITRSSKIILIKDDLHNIILIYLNNKSTYFPRNLYHTILIFLRIYTIESTLL
jgi:hypothetical protein